MTTIATDTTADTTTTGNGKRTREAPTAIEAITKIGKILAQLSPTDRKRVLAFVNVNESESGAA